MISAEGFPSCRRCRCVSVIALWLGHESVETTQIYLNANLALKEKILAKTTPHEGRVGSYRPGDQLLAFLNGL